MKQKSFRFVRSLFQLSISRLVIAVSGHTLRRLKVVSVYYYEHFDNIKLGQFCCE